MRRKTPVMVKAWIMFIILSSGFAAQNPLAAATKPGTDIFVDQLGYLPDLPKTVIAAKYATQFRVVDNLNSQVIYQGKLEACQDPTSGRRVWRGDFSSVRKIGNYRIEMPGVGQSYPFAIATKVYNELLRVSLRSYYLQRCGTALRDPETGFAHPPCHEEDGYLAGKAQSGSGNQAIDCRGGWHDAGDYGKYTPTTAITAAQLLAAYELGPEKFSDGQLGIPESGNGCPDILDEARIGLEWLLKMQRSDGAVYHKVAGRYWALFNSPEIDRQKRYIYGISTANTAKTAAVMAMASRVFQPWDPAFAARARQAAHHAWLFLNSHPNLWEHQETDDQGSGNYPANDDRGDRLWAMLELALLPGEGPTRQSLATALTGNWPVPLEWSNGAFLGLFDYARAADGDPALRKVAKSQILSLVARFQKTATASAYQYSLNYQDFYWASNKEGLVRGMAMWGAAYLQAGGNLKQLALAQLHFILGLNPLSKCFVSGVGANPVRKPHHRWCSALGKPIPGFLAGGPNQQSESGIEPIGKGPFSYADEEGSYSSNEPAIDYNAALVFMAAAFAAP